MNDIKHVSPITWDLYVKEKGNEKFVRQLTQTRMSFQIWRLHVLPGKMSLVSQIISSAQNKNKQRKPKQQQKQTTPTPTPGTGWLRDSKGKWFSGMLTFMEQTSTN